MSSMSTLSREENDTVISSEDSSSYPNESELELGLELSLGGGSGGKAWVVKPPAAAAGACSWDRYARILTANDFPAVVSAKVAASSSSSSSSPVAKANNHGCGKKRAAEPSSPPGRSAVSSQVVGWPPISNRRMNSLGTQSKLRATEESASTVNKCKGANIVMDKTDYISNQTNNVAKDNGLVKTSFFVKVNMDGIPIGRKVDLNAHSCYKTLAHTLDGMFKLDKAAGSKVGEHASQPLSLLDGSSDFVLTYEDKEGDWMLVGDVPWEMFLSSARRLRIRSASKAR